MPEDEKVRAEKGFELIVTEGFILSDREASAQGLMAEFEDVIDSLWASIPTDKKVRTKIYKEDLSDRRSAILEWQEAETIRPGNDLPESKRRTDPSNRRRALRKKQILTDVLSGMRILFKEPKTSRMVEDDDEDT
jgi:hypothetical protein